MMDYYEKKGNNIIERLQNTLRRFLHPRRGFHSLKTGETQLAGYWIFYNFIRFHTAIGKTPAESAGLAEYQGLKTNKERLARLIQKAVIFWLTILLAGSETHQP